MSQPYYLWNYPHLFIDRLWRGLQKSKLVSASVARKSRTISLHNCTTAQGVHKVLHFLRPQSRSAEEGFLLLAAANGASRTSADWISVAVACMFIWKWSKNKIPPFRNLHPRLDGVRLCFRKPPQINLEYTAIMNSDARIGYYLRARSLQCKQQTLTDKRQDNNMEMLESLESRDLEWICPITNAHGTRH